MEDRVVRALMIVTTDPSSGFWQLTHVSDDQLVAGLGSLIQACRRVTARVIAHLAEVEERRLHLRAACSSMFVYCTERLGMSEDEACRRIDAARIARRYPLAYRLLDAGELTLTVLCLLKDMLTLENHAELGRCLEIGRHASGWRRGFPGRMRRR
jgi:hypothetical protein